MRVLFVSNPGIGHVNPMFPMAHQLRKQGHEILFATARNFCSVIEAQGFKAEPAGLDWSEPEAASVFPEMENLPVHERGMFLIREVFSDAAAHPMVSSLLTIAGAWKPDLIIRNDYEFGSCVAAKILGLPLITISICFYMPMETVTAAIGEQLAYLRSAYGLPPLPVGDMLYPDLYLTYAPEEMEPRVSNRIQGITIPEPINIDENVIPEFEISDRPLIYLSLGTVFNRNQQVFQVLFEALRNQPVNVIATIGRNQDVQQYGVQPEHIRILQYIPQEWILPKAALFITHSPFYTALSALRQGVPLLMLPQSGDQPAHALRFARNGVGLVLHSGDAVDEDLQREASELTVSNVTFAIEELLSNPKYRSRANSVKEQMESLLPLSEAVSLLEQCVNISHVK